MHKYHYLQYILIYHCDVKQNGDLFFLTAEYAI